MDAAKAATGQPPSTLSANNGGAWGTPYQLFDYGIGELTVDIWLSLYIIL